MYKIYATDAYNLVSKNLQDVDGWIYLGQYNDLAYCYERLDCLHRSWKVKIQKDCKTIYYANGKG